jgi:predicted TIM-barrel fold metal-dependent hydrolase
VKLSAPYRVSSACETDADLLRLIRTLAESATGRLVWGTDWPHPTSPNPVPGDDRLAALVFDWLPDPAMREAVLVQNPDRLYWDAPRNG